jgi:uncharacterized protein with NAD-binding domain and iron-sulfur cluster
VRRCWLRPEPRSTPRDGTPAVTPDRVVILGGGMAGMAAAWRLSEPGWRERHASITVYQRGFRLGGKGASSRGRHGRVEEHGLHVWLGYYDNAFRLMRECYAELDRATTDPSARVRDMADAFIPANEVGLEDRHGDEWHHWVSAISGNDAVPGSLDGGAPLDPLDLVRRAVTLIRDFLLSVGVTPGVRLGSSADPGPGGPPLAGSVGATLLPLVLEVGEALRGMPMGSTPLAPIDALLAATGAQLRDDVLADPGTRRVWQLLALVLAVARGVLVEERILDPHGLRELNEVEFGAWLARHGAPPEALDSSMKRGLSDLVFGWADGDLTRPGFGAGLGVFLTYRTFLDFNGSIFWKMAAGMGDIVFAPMYQVLRARGVEFELLHRLDALHLSQDGTRIGAITLGRQARLAAGVERYEPLVRVRDLPCFPDRPLLEQLDADPAIVDAPLESHWCQWPDAEQRVLRDGVDFDTVVFAIPPSMAEHTCAALIADNPAWADMVTHVRTVATQAFQVWLRDREPDLGWPHPGTTVSGYVTPFDTWASMPQLIDVEDWPTDDAPGTIAYFCSVLDAPWPPTDDAPAYEREQQARVRAHAVRFLREHIGHLLPGTVDGDGFRWELLCGAEAQGEGAFDSQFWRANVDPSDRYVQSLPGSDRYRLRPDESGYDNLFLAGDWTDCGLNAGCIEAATMSGLVAANAVHGRPRFHRIAGSYLP